MITLLKRELSTFFNSLIGYIVIIVFLLINGLFIWVFPGDMNVLDAGYSTLNSLFAIAPWVFLFLIPAITMKSFAEEKDKGTIELLFTRPISDVKIILSKFLAALLVAIIALIPTLIYFVSIYQLGNPIGNIDTGSTWGSFIGLFFLAAIYASIGVFASSLTSNQIVAFILAMVFSFLFFAGFDNLSALFGNKFEFIAALGINAHYESISRGVIDSRDILYYLSVVTIFIFSTKLVLQSQKW